MKLKGCLAKDTSVFEEFAEFAAIRLRQQERDRIGDRIGAYAIVKRTWTRRYGSRLPRRTRGRTI